jgi:hypothetical protein
MTNLLIPFFKAGTWRDANGIERTWSLDDIDHACTQFNNLTPELKRAVPITINHPADNLPVFGFVRECVRVGEFLMAIPDRVSQMFKVWVNRGFFPNRSIAFFEDGTINHFGFLEEGIEPAVKGLGSFLFQSADFPVCQYAVPDLPVPAAEELAAFASESPDVDFSFTPTFSPDVSNVIPLAQPASPPPAPDVLLQQLKDQQNEINLLRKEKAAAVFKAALPVTLPQLPLFLSLFQKLSDDFNIVDADAAPFKLLIEIANSIPVSNVDMNHNIAAPVPPENKPLHTLDTPVTYMAIADTIRNNQ